MARYNYQLAAAWNNAAGLSNIESIAVSGGEDLSLLLGRLVSPIYYLAHTLEPYDLPFEITAGGSMTQRGYAKAILNFPVMGVKSYDYLDATYAQGNSTTMGKVTVKLRSNDFNTYVNYNAIMQLAKAPKPIYRSSKYWYQDVQVTFLIRGVAS